MSSTIITILALTVATGGNAFVSTVLHPTKSISQTSLFAKVGIFFGTSTGSTQEAADLISAAFGDEAASEPIDIEEVDSVADEFSKYDALIVGTPTWNTGADTERSGTGWDEIYYSEMQELDIAGKKVAVFGLGDSISYSENYGDATGELHDVFEKLGCVMMGYTSQEGYEHDDSKAIRGDKFCGLLLDAVNQEELTDDRVKNWVDKLFGEGFLESNGGEVAAAPPAAVSSSTPKVETADEVVMEDQALAEEIIKQVKETRKVCFSIVLLCEFVCLKCSLDDLVLSLPYLITFATHMY